ncbi:LysE family translocator [Corynebacterium choanae]|uniref:Leucine export protein LeuE n=1 Tax=Corynebacterium choanae TaxID=1862358 RepID=A0A3G6J902_9CORY|nr:LysE family translocator [Corynebacterium choanae]AZA14466.1 leucine export protein LeuE [Corynebacterium choanae]
MLLSSSLLAACLSLALAVTVLIAMPGPAIVFLVNQTLTQSRRAAFASMWGHMLGATVLGLVLVVLLGSLVSTYPIIHLIIRIAGAVVLLLLGLSYLTSKHHLDPQPNPQQPTGNRPSPQQQPLLAGFVLGATNIKVVIAYTTIVPTFLPQDVQPLPGLIILALVPTIIGIISDSAWIQAAHLVRGKLAADSPVIGRITRAGGIILILLAIATFTGRLA